MGNILLRKVYAYATINKESRLLNVFYNHLILGRYGILTSHSTTFLQDIPFKQGFSIIPRSCHCRTKSTNSWTSYEQNMAMVRGKPYLKIIFLLPQLNIILQGRGV